MARPADPLKRQRLLTAVQSLVLARGFSGTSVDEICSRAGVTKGSFFHNFKNKDAAAAAALGEFAGSLVESFEDAPFRRKRRALDRVLGYIDHTADICESSILADGCLVGGLALELSDTHPDLRTTCGHVFVGWAESFADLVNDAAGERRPRSAVDAKQLGLELVALVEGSLLIAKATEDKTLVRRNLRSFRDRVRRALEPITETKEESA